MIMNHHPASAKFSGLPIVAGLFAFGPFGVGEKEERERERWTDEISLWPTDCFAVAFVFADLFEIYFHNVL